MLLVLKGPCMVGKYIMIKILLLNPQAEWGIGYFNSTISLHPKNEKKGLL
jgi:hypothetical protein